MAKGKNSPSAFFDNEENAIYRTSWLSVTLNDKSMPVVNFDPRDKRFSDDAEHVADEFLGYITRIIMEKDSSVLVDKIYESLTDEMVESDSKWGLTPKTGKKKLYALSIKHLGKFYPLYRPEENIKGFPLTRAIAYRNAVVKLLGEVTRESYRQNLNATGIQHCDYDKKLAIINKALARLS